ncbi:MAG: pantoate--beta-alanine ligase [Bacteroidales bacterium]
MQIIRNIKELKEQIALFRDNKKTIGLVPTMGALHKGHVSLVQYSCADNDITVATIFVNPTQFNNKEDLRLYPRTEDNDCDMLESAGCDIVFIPTVEEIYPEEDTRIFELGAVAEVMEGAMRPGHFNGVAQIVSNLFSYVNPDRAYFGEKDFQQIAVIRQLVKIEERELEIISCPIIREDDGLAMSSRNTRLTQSQRTVAPNINRILNETLPFANNRSVAETIQYVTENINAIDEMEVEYYQIVDGITLQPITEWSQSAYAVGCITVYCGEVRLIDNITYYK